MTDDVIAQLIATPRSPRRLLEDLAALARVLAGHDRPRPEVELYLAGGQVVRGRLAGVVDDGGATIAMVITGGQPRTPALAYVRVDHVVAVIAADASLLVRAPVSDQPAPRKLELARALGARAESLTTALGRALPMTTVAELDDDGRRAVAALLPALVDTLRAIARDGMGKQALDALAGVELGAAAQPAVQRADGKLVVLAPKLAMDAWAPARLRAELEKLL